MSASLEERLKRIEDREEIRRLIVDYGRLLDAKDFKGYADLFAQDGGEWHGGFGKLKGRTEIEAAMIKYMGGGAGPARANYHLMSSIEIDVEGDEGKAWSRWTFILYGADNRPAIAASGAYNDTFVRENGSWKFRRRIVTADGPPPQFANS